MISTGAITAIGVHPPETAIPPREFLERLDERGIRISGYSWN
jgi:hypothetical protein